MLFVIVYLLLFYLFLLQLTRDGGSVESYPSPYDLSVHFQWVRDTVGYNIIEPACDILTMVSHKNVGGMPTPSYQFIRSYVNDNQWVTTQVCLSIYYFPFLLANYLKRLRTEFH